MGKTDNLTDDNFTPLFTSTEVKNDTSILDKKNVAQLLE